MATVSATPAFNGDSNPRKKPPEDDANFKLPGEIPLVSLLQEALNTSVSDDLRQEETPPAAPED